MAKTRVLVVEDSLTIRRHIADTLHCSADLEVVGEAADGKSAIELAQQLRPDVITLDMMLPVMTGLAVTEYVMAHHPTPILIVSASTNRGELFRTYDALAAGAVDVLEKPNHHESFDSQWEQKLIETVRLVSRIKVITHLRGRFRSAAPAASSGVRSADAAVGDYKLIAIGASTGGPGALAAIFRTLPADFPIPILVVIHIGKQFASAFAEWLDGQSNLRVTYARDGDFLPEAGSGKILIAPADSHLVVKHGKLRLTHDPEQHSCRPSIDVLFESIAAELPAQCVACLLTGMGRDGARGLDAIRKSGGPTIAQDEASSTVFGMPREAIQIGAAERVLSIEQIAPALIAYARRARQ